MWRTLEAMVMTVVAYPAWRKALPVPLQLCKLIGLPRRPIPLPLQIQRPGNPRQSEAFFIATSFPEGRVHDLQRKTLQDKFSWVESNSLRPHVRSPPGSSVRVISQARILVWVAVSFSRGLSRPRDWTHVSYIVGKFSAKPPGRRKWQPTAVFLPRESHGRRSLAGYSP